MFFYSKKFRYKKIRYYKLTELEFLSPIVGELSEYFQELQIWRPSMTAQILLVFKKLRFFDFFIFFFQKNEDIKK